MQTRRLKIGFQLLAIVLVCGLAARPGLALAEDAASGAHGDSHAATPSGESGGGRTPAGADAGAGGTTLDAHGSRDDAGKNRQGGAPAGDETAKGVAPAAPGGNDDAGAANANIAPSRHLDRKRNKVGEGRAAIKPVKPNLHRRMLSVSPVPNRPARNAIGVPVPAHQNAERRESVHPGALGVPHITPGGVTAAPGSLGGRLVRRPNANPIVVPAAPNRSAVSGTGLTRRNVGPSQIGGPKASVVGVNGTTIKPKY